MKAGQLNRRITFQQKSVTQSPVNGEEVISWVDVATVWAQFDPVRGREFFTSKQQYAEAVTWFRIRFRPGLTPDMRIRFQSKNYDIDSIVNVGGRNAEIEIFAKEGLTNG